MMLAASGCIESCQHAVGEALRRIGADVKSRRAPAGGLEMYLQEWCRPRRWFVVLGLPPPASLLLFPILSRVQLAFCSQPCYRGGERTCEAQAHRLRAPFAPVPTCPARRSADGLCLRHYRLLGSRSADMPHAGRFSKRRPEGVEPKQSRAPGGRGRPALRCADISCGR